MNLNTGTKDYISNNLLDMDDEPYQDLSWLRLFAILQRYDVQLLHSMFLKSVNLKMKIMMYSFINQ
jgi:hypothetical protein